MAKNCLFVGTKSNNITSNSIAFAISNQTQKAFGRSDAKAGHCTSLIL